MDTGVYYGIFIAILFMLAVGDLIVGVANDAVNFLNSAIGARVAGRRVILAVAAAGIAIGAMTSSGMMEVARKGIFNPGMFVFSDIMIIFIAVMLTDVIMLDFFNTFGMPTSTTVSIVFELLGSATIIAAYKIITTGGAWSTLPNYINNEEAIFIVSGIFISIVIAFALGMLIQYAVRAIFTFQYESLFKKYGGIFCGLAFTIIMDFILLKGIKSASFIDPSFNEFVEANTLYINGFAFIAFTLISYLLILSFKVNLLRYIVLAGTFSLALAFAGNDLVNFIGVPIAGLISYQYWKGSGESPENLKMDFLASEVATSPWLLIIAGAIMTLTLIYSKKANSVTATQVNLVRQGTGSERFKPNVVSRAIVGGSLVLGHATRFILPNRFYQAIETRFEQIHLTDIPDNDRPAFDLLRASVNLIVAAVLIAFATSLKLPLSTTYVTFMVAMGASLSDRAWNRDSAVYRVAGVVNVIAGWFFTAIIAFTSAGLMALLILTTGIWGLLFIAVLAIVLLLRSNFFHRKSQSAAMSQGVWEKHKVEWAELKAETGKEVEQSLQLISRLFASFMDVFSSSNGQGLKHLRRELKTWRHQQEAVRASLISRIQKMQVENSKGIEYFTLLNHLQNVQQSLKWLGDEGKNHVDNFHNSLDSRQLSAIQTLHTTTTGYLNSLQQWLHSNDDGAWIPDQLKDIERQIDDLLSDEFNAIKSNRVGVKSASLLTGILLETKDLVKETTQLVIHFKGF